MRGFLRDIFVLVFCGLCLFLSVGEACGQDDCFPLPDAFGRDIGCSLHRLLEEKSRLEGELERLAPASPAIQQRFFGFHSQIFDRTAKDLEQWITVKFSALVKPSSICIIPAYDLKRGAGGAYAFPQRFQIELTNSVLKESWVVVDWSNANFPDPGMSPVLFSSSDWEKADGMIFTVFEDNATQNKGFFALGELLVYGEDDFREGEYNVLEAPSVDIEASGQYAIEDRWAKRFLNDGIFALGQPLGLREKTKPDFFLKRMGQPSNLVVIDIDLGATMPVDKVVLYPRYASTVLPRPFYANPVHFSLLLSRNASFSNPVFSFKEVDQWVTDAGVISLDVQGKQLRYIRLIEDPPDFSTAYALALSEIGVFSAGKLVSVDPACTLTSWYVADAKRVNSLTDGVSNGRKIIDQKQWLFELNKRRIILRQLDHIHERVVQIKSSWQKLIIICLSIGFILLLAGVVFWSVWQMYERRQALEKQRKVIARDLHDDVGNSVGGILAVVEKLMESDMEPSLKEELEDICYNANEAVSSLTEAIWVTDYGMVSMSDLLDRFREQAWRVMPNANVSLVIMGVLSDKPLRPWVKRQFSLFFKAVIHNCAKHSSAKNVRIECSICSDLFRLVVLDDGVGFDVAKAQKSDGIMRIKERAKEFGGKVRFESVINHGSTVVLEVPYTLCVEG